MTQPPSNDHVKPPPGETTASRLAGFTNISAGAGAVLVLFPSFALFFGHGMLAADPAIGLPTVAIFGILILFGALALVSTMFRRLKLHCREEALALPPGSIRAVIALALIVLFALMSVMLYHSLSASSATIEHLSEASKQALLQESRNRVTAVIPVPCPGRAAATGAATPATPAASDASQAASQAAASGASGVANAPAKSGRADDEACANGAAFSYTVQLGNVPASPAVDFAKQLLTLIGTLMTSVVSFYFAARSSDASAKSAMNAVAQAIRPAPSATAPLEAGKDDDEHDHEHGAIKNPTRDDELPKAAGGVVPQPKGDAS